MNQKNNRKNGFTFIELMVVITIIGILAAISVNTAQYVRIGGRDARRISDINQIRSALNLYYSKYSQYPTAITPGQQFSVNGIIYLQTVPENPRPRNDGVCDINKDYDYEQRDGGISYTLGFCLGYNQGSVQAGPNVAVPEGIVIE